MNVAAIMACICHEDAVSFQPSKSNCVARSSHMKSTLGIHEFFIFTSMARSARRSSCCQHNPVQAPPFLVEHLEGRNSGFHFMCNGDFIRACKSPNLVSNRREEHQSCMVATKFTTDFYTIFRSSLLHVNVKLYILIIKLKYEYFKNMFVF